MKKKLNVTRRDTLSAMVLAFSALAKKCFFPPMGLLAYHAGSSGEKDSLGYCHSPSQFGCSFSVYLTNELTGQYWGFWGHSTNIAPYDSD